MRTSTLFRVLAGWPLASLLLVAGGGSSKPAASGSGKEPTPTFKGVVAGTAGQARRAAPGAAYARVRNLARVAPEPPAGAPAPVRRAADTRPTGADGGAAATAQAPPVPEARILTAGPGAAAGATPVGRMAQSGRPGAGAGASPAPPRPWESPLAVHGLGQTESKAAWTRYQAGAPTPPDTGPGGAGSTQVEELPGADLPFLDLGTAALDEDSGDGRPRSRPLRYENGFGVDVRLVLAAAPGSEVGRVRILDPGHPGRYPLFPTAGRQLAPDEVIYLHPDPRAARTFCLVLDRSGALLETFGLELEPPAPPSSPRGAGQ